MKNKLVELEIRHLENPKGVLFLQRLPVGAVPPVSLGNGAASNLLPRLGDTASFGDRDRNTETRYWRLPNKAPCEINIPNPYADAVLLLAATSVQPSVIILSLESTPVPNEHVRGAGYNGPAFPSGHIPSLLRHESQKSLYQQNLGGRLLRPPEPRWGQSP